MSNQSSASPDSNDWWPAREPNYNAWTKAQLRAEIKERGIDQPYGGIELTRRTSREEMRSALYNDDFLLMPCWCFACRGSRAFNAGDWEDDQAQLWIAHLRSRAESDPESSYLFDLRRYDMAMRWLERADETREKASREEPGSEFHQMLAEREQSLRADAQRLRMLDVRRTPNQQSEREENAR